MASAVSRFDRASAAIARAPDSDGDEGDLVHARVDQISAEHDFAANAASVRTTDDMVGSLLNIIA